MSGEDVLSDIGPPNLTRDGSGTVRRRRSHRARSKRASGRGTKANKRGSRSVSRARSGVREVYEKEIRRVRRRSGSSGSVSVSPAPPAKVAGSTVSVARKGESVRRSRAPSAVEYEVINLGRTWVDVEPSQSNLGRRSEGWRMSRPQATHARSYVRERGDGGSRPGLHSSPSR